VLLDHAHFVSMWCAYVNIEHPTYNTHTLFSMQYHELLHKWV